MLLSCVLLAACAPQRGAEGPNAAEAAAEAERRERDAAMLPGREFGISDAPTSGEGAERPELNASAAAAYASGMDAFRSAELAIAQTKFLEATQADPRAYQAYYSLGVVRERLGDTPGAQAAYRQSIAIVGDYEPAILAYGVSLARHGQTAEAESFLTERLAAMPKSAAVPAALSEVKSLQRDSGAAQRYAQESLKKNPSYRPAMLAIARDHYRARRLDLALYALRGILDGYGVENPPRDRDSAEARLLRGLIYKEQGQRVPAMQELKWAIESRPDLVEARLHLATYMLESGNAVEAVEILQNAVRYDRANVLCRLNLGDAYRLLGRVSDARRELEWVVRADSSRYQAHYALGLLYLFASSIPGMTPLQAVDRAIAELELYQKQRPRLAGSGDDTEELITRAKTKKSLLEAESEEAKAGTGDAP